MAFVQGDHAALLKIYSKAVMRKNKLSQSTMGTHLDSTLLPSQKDVELCEMITMIIKKNLPLGITEDSDYRYATVNV